jgi:hypothetical protein
MEEGSLTLKHDQKQSNSSRFDGKAAVETGAASGIGLATGDFSISTDEQ